MQVILLEKIRNLGDLGQTVTVKPGYGRNFLIPYKKAVFATPENLSRFEKQRAELEKRAQEVLAEAQKRAEVINSSNVTIEAQASDEGKLYGSVGINEIKEELDKKGIDVSKREITLPEGPFYSVGEYQVEVHLHSDVVASLKVEVIPSK